MYLLEDDPRQKRDIEAQIDLILHSNITSSPQDEVILPPNESVQSAEGEILIGNIEYLGENKGSLRIQLKDLNRHLGLFGSTGSGKTTTALHIIRQVHRLGIPFLIIDWETSWRVLAREIPDLEVLTVGKDINPLHLNILQVPKGISKSEYAKSLISLMAEDFLSGAGSDSMLLKYLEEVYSEYPNPTFRTYRDHVYAEVQNEIKKKGKLGGRSGLWKETVLRILYFLSSGGSAEVFLTDKHYPIERLLNRPIVLELGHIKNPRDRRFIVHLLLNWIFFHYQYEGINNEYSGLRQVIAFEEFHNITIKGREDPLIDPLFREIRKYGVGLMVMDQTPSQIPNSVFANINTKIALSLSTSQDIYSMAKAMNLQQDQARYLGMLPTGKAIVAVKQSLSEPLLVSIPYTETSSFLGDDELRSIISEVSKDSHIKIDGEGKTRDPQVSQKDDTLPPPSEIVIDSMERIVLTDIIEKPYEGVDKRGKRLGLHPSQIKAIHDSLVKKGILRPVIIDNKKMFEIRKEHYETLYLNGIEPPKIKGKGSLEHNYIVKMIYDHLLKLGLKPEVEFEEIDLVVRSPSPLLAVEVETGKSQPYKSQYKLIRSGFKHKYMIATRKETLLQLQENIKHSGVKLLFWKEFLKLNKNQLS